MANFDDAIYHFVQNLQEAFAAETARTVRLAGQKFEKVVEGYRDIAKNGPMFERANNHLASLMREAVLTAYRDNVLAHAPASYREGDKRHPGELLTALESPTFAIGDAHGIGFIDVQALDRAGRFWARLNFGAGPNIGNTVHAFPAVSARIQFGANQGISLRLTSPPRENFSVPQNMPVGHFNAEGQFFPFGPSRKEGVRDGLTIVKSAPSKSGIGARRFLDAGLVALAANFKDTYVREMEETARNAAGPAKNVRIR